MKKLLCGKCKKENNFHYEGKYARCNCGALNKINVCSCGHSHEKLDNIYEDDGFVNKDEGDYSIREWLGFNYPDYLKSINEVINEYDFKELLGVSLDDIKKGKLTQMQISKLKNTLKSGFNNHKTIKVIADDIQKNVNPGVIYGMRKDGTKFKRFDEKIRSLLIAKSETVRMGQMGIVKNGIENGAKQFRWIASYGERTCEICEDLNNQIFNADEVPDYPHIMCRCTIEPYP